MCPRPSRDNALPARWACLQRHREPGRTDRVVCRPGLTGELVIARAGALRPGKAASRNGPGARQRAGTCTGDLQPPRGV